MKTAVVIPTYNGRHRLPVLLNALRKQVYAEFTTHVLIDGSTDGSIDLAKEFPECEFHAFENSGRAGNRNKALEVTDAQLLVFLDDDMLPVENLIAHHINFHKATSNAILIGNGFRNPRESTDEFGQYLIAAEDKSRNIYPADYIVNKDRFTFSACNMSIPAQLFQQLGNFNTALRDGEDFEFGMRALTAGVEITYSRNALAWHNDWPTLEQYIHRNSEYLAGKKVLVKMNPEFEKYLKVDAGERSHNRFKQLLQTILGRAAMKKSLLFRILPLHLKFVAYKSAIYQFSKA